MTNSNGFAFAIGHSVHWYPTRGIAKHERYLAKNSFPGFVSPVEPATKEEAHRWAKPFKALIWD